jgi:hypothetical protein
MIDVKAYEASIRDTAQLLSGNHTAKYMGLAVTIETTIAHEEIRSRAAVKIDRKWLVARIFTMARTLATSAVTELHLQLAASIEVAIAVEEQRGFKKTIDRDTLADRIHDRTRAFGSSVATDNRLIAASIETMLVVQEMRK